MQGFTLDDVNPVNAEQSESNFNASRIMSFLLQRRSKAVVPTPDPPDPPIRRLPNRGVIEASVLVVPPDGSVHETGMKCAEFDVESDYMLRM